MQQALVCSDQCPDWSVGGQGGLRTKNPTESHALHSTRLHSTRHTRGTCWVARRQEACGAGLDEAARGAPRLATVARHHWEGRTAYGGPSPSQCQPVGGPPGFTLAPIVVRCCCWTPRTFTPWAGHTAHTG